METVLGITCAVWFALGIFVYAINLEIAVMTFVQLLTLGEGIIGSLTLLVQIRSDLMGGNNAT